MLHAQKDNVDETQDTNNNNEYDHNTNVSANNVFWLIS